MLNSTEAKNKYTARSLTLQTTDWPDLKSSAAEQLSQVTDLVENWQQFNDLTNALRQRLEQTEQRLDRMAIEDLPKLDLKHLQAYLEQCKTVSRISAFDKDRFWHVENINIMLFPSRPLIKLLLKHVLG